MNVRKDGMENWMVESGVFVVCPIEHLAERLGISEDEIEQKLGHVHGIITVESFSKVRVDKSYMVDKNGNTYAKIEMTPEKLIMSDAKVDPVRMLEEDELLFDEYYESQKGKIKNNNIQQHIAQTSIMLEKYKNIILERSNKTINKT